MKSPFNRLPASTEAIVWPCTIDSHVLTSLILVESVRTDL